MDSQPQADAERAQVLKCQHGDSESLAQLRGRHNPTLRQILCARGATPTEADDLLADLWADCVPGEDDRPSLLQKFNGKCSLQGWLATVATRRWIDLKRRQTRRVDIPPPIDGSTNFFERVPDSGASGRDDILVSLLRESLKSAFALCPAQSLLMLRLVYVHGLTQREVMRMWGWTESKVSRALSQAMRDIETNTLQHLKQADRWLELTWQDFTDLCETHQLSFL
jgi:RNA polymerase sigma factor (sigma-70 family)